jgi:hypothetical protein
MAKLIFIRTSYSGGIALPIDYIDCIKSMIIVKTSGYNDLSKISIDKDCSVSATVIESRDIVNQDQISYELEDAKRDLKHSQDLVESLEAKLVS